MKFVITAGHGDADPSANTTSLTAPSLTDPSLNTAYKNQVVNQFV